MSKITKKKIIIVGGGFAGLEMAKGLSNQVNIDLTLIDRANHHLFQPLLYQVAMSELSPAEIAMPIRTILSSARNISVVLDEAVDINLASKQVRGRKGEYSFDYLVLACGATHSYFGNDAWEETAPGLKTLSQALEIRRRILLAFENAEREKDEEKRKRFLTFVIVGAGPTGVELAGALAELRRFTLARDFRSIDTRKTQIHLIEAGPRVLPAYSPKLSDKATRDLEKLGVTVHLGRPVTDIRDGIVKIGQGEIHAENILWAAGVKPSKLNEKLNTKLDRSGRVLVKDDLSLEEFENVFVLGDQAVVFDDRGRPLPAIAPVAVQEGRFAAKCILGDLRGEKRGAFTYQDRGMMATIGRAKAVMQRDRLQISGPLAWWTWVFVHIYFLIGFRNRVLVMLVWIWSYLTFRKGARLIVPKSWRFFDPEDPESSI